MSGGVFKVLVIFKDPYGAPRAWGLADTEEAARAEANAQLDAYLRDPVREFRLRSSYTSHVEYVRDEVE